MRSILGKLILAPVVMAAAALATSTAMAETTLKVPFSFTAAGKVWPAGNYTVQRDRNIHFVTLTSKDNSQSFEALIGPGDPDPASSQIVLKFDAMGGTHALRTIQYESAITSRLNRNASRAEYLSTRGR